MKFVVTPTTDAAMSGRETDPTPSALMALPVSSTKPNCVSASVIATAPPTRNMLFHGACCAVSFQVTSALCASSADGIVNNRNMTAGGTTQMFSARLTTVVTG